MQEYSSVVSAFPIPRSCLPSFSYRAGLLAVGLFLGPVLAASTNLALHRPVKADLERTWEYWAEDAVDGDNYQDRSRWVSSFNVPFPHWIEIDLGHVGYTLNQLKFWTGSGDGGYGSAITQFRLQYWDGSGWIDVLTRTNSQNGGIFNESFASTPVSRRIRWLAEAGSVNSQVRMYEIETWGDPHPLPVVSEFPAHDGVLVDPEDHLVLTFGEPVQALNLGQVQVLNRASLSVVEGTTASVSGASLSIAGVTLLPGGQYTVKIPAGTVERVASPGSVNGPAFWDFSVAPADPQLVDYPRKGSDLIASLDYTFDREIALISASGIALTYLDDGSAVTGVSASVVNGTQLRIVHDALDSGRSLYVTIPAGALQGVFNSVANEGIEKSYHPEEYQLVQGDFVDGMNGFETAVSLGLLNPGARRWFRMVDQVGRQGPGLDYRYVETSALVPGDFLVSPVFEAVAGERYSLQVSADTSDVLNVSLSPSRDLNDLTLLGSIPSTKVEEYQVWNPNREVNFTATESGPVYLIFSNPPDNHPWAVQRIDNINLVKEVAPEVLISSPLDGAVYRESDSILLQAKVFGITGELTKVEFYDGAQLLSTQTQAPFEFSWANHIPGNHQMRVVATDSRGSVAERGVTVQVTFDDGSLSPFINWDFNDGAQGWVNHGGPGALPKEAGADDFWRFNQSASTGLFLSSPEVFLFAGETYTFTFDAGGNASTRIWKFAAQTAPGYPASPGSGPSFAISDTNYLYQLNTATFTVPADGAYFLTLFDTALSGRAEVQFDNFRLIGDFNSIPLVAITGADEVLETITDIAIQLTAEASDLDGSITMVEYFDGANKIGQAVEAPYTISWVGFSSGDHAVVARAHDDRNGFSDSEPYLIRVHPNPFSLATLFGNEGTGDAVNALAYQANGTLILGANADPSEFPGVTPVYLNGSVVGDRGCIVRLTEDGGTVLSVSVVGETVLDLSLDASGRIYVAALTDGVVVLNALASAVDWAGSYAKPAHRIDAGPEGYFAALLAPSTEPYSTTLSSAEIVVYDPARNLLSNQGGASAYTQDVCIDEASQTVIVCGYKNLIAETEAQAEPVDVPVYKGRGFEGTLKYVGYDWSGNASAGSRWLNQFDNNMADTRIYRCIIGGDGLLYLGMEQDGGNSPTRYDPFVLDQSATVVGGDAYHEFYNVGTVPKIFVGRYRPSDGAYLLGQRQTNRLASGNDNTLRIRGGGLEVDAVGRIHIVSTCAFGLPLTVDFHPGTYTGGAYYIIWSPDMATRELVSRTSRGNTHHAIALSPSGKVAFGGDMDRGEFYLTTENAWQGTPDVFNEGMLLVGDFRGFYSYQPGVHPRLFFNESEVAALRERAQREPYLSMVNRLVANLTDPLILDHDMPYWEASYGLEKAFLYVLTGDEAYAEQARAHVETILNRPAYPWADAGQKGLTSYYLGSRVAMIFDWCANAPSWDSTFDFVVSQALRDMGKVIVENGGTEQNSSPSSNWQAGRGGSGGLCLLATDHAYGEELLDSAYTRVGNYLSQNFQGGTTRGWNPEGLGYTYYPFGNFVGPFGIAMARHDPARDLRHQTAMQWAYWTIFSTASTALNIYHHGGLKPDWSDDNAHIGGEGTYGQAFYFLPDSLKPGAKWAYDRLQGAQSASPRWDAFRSGSIWSILYYPEDLPAVDPVEIWDWHRGSDDSGGLGVMTFRNAYDFGAGDDFLAQFKVRRYSPGGHNGPDGLGIRIIGDGVPWVVGGGRNDPGKKMGQPTLYPAFPNTNTATNLNNGTLVGTPLFKPDGGGHVIAEMALNNVGTQSHKRWFVADYDRSLTGADATFIIADTSTNGLFWHLPTFVKNSISVSGNTFTFTGANGATMKGTVLYPTSVSITSGTMLRGSRFAYENEGNLWTGDAEITDNGYINFQSPDGDYLVVLTVQKAGAHPTVARLSGTVANATVQVGGLEVTLQSAGVLYQGEAYTPPSATITFDAGGHGSLNGIAVQTIPYGGSAIGPIVTADSGYNFLGWNKAFDQVVRSMTVTALFGVDGQSSHRAAWLASYGLPIDGSGAGAHDQDVDRDGIPLLLEYVLRGDPENFDAGILPVLSLDQEGADFFLKVRYLQPEGGVGTRGFDYRVDGMTIRVETTSTLNVGPWASESGSFSIVSATSVGDGWEEVVLRATSPLPALQFVRLSIVPD